MRGKACLCITGYRNFGITPAYAGKRTGTRNSIAAFRDHPRLCGEKKWKKRKSALRSGSPPPMRGKVRAGKLRHEQPRITPAYAGKSVHKFIVDSEVRDHPRLCGEKSALIACPQSEAGSPPPMRGKVSDAHEACIRRGITPAYAGKS